LALSPGSRLICDVAETFMLLNVNRMITAAKKDLIFKFDSLIMKYLLNY
jgi:hypothetical protein